LSEKEGKRKGRGNEGPASAVTREASQRKKKGKNAPRLERKKKEGKRAAASVAFLDDYSPATRKKKQLLIDRVHVEKEKKGKRKKPQLSL